MTLFEGYMNKTEVATTPLYHTKEANGTIVLEALRWSAFVYRICRSNLRHLAADREVIMRTRTDNSHSLILVSIRRTNSFRGYTHHTLALQVTLLIRIRKSTCLVDHLGHRVTSLPSTGGIANLSRLGFMAPCRRRRTPMFLETRILLICSHK